ncbi:MAG: hypothetical protein JXB10_00455 [Pirellulales bacterium]|nr:hypothetical protein [Pirellulales bacterium]
MKLPPCFLPASTIAWLFLVFLIPGVLPPVQAIEKQPMAEQTFDAAFFADKNLSDNRQDFTLRWNEPRNIRWVEVTFAPGGSLPKAENLHVQYWHRNWNGLADPPLQESDPAAQGWKKDDDWTNGRWKDADTRLRQEGSRFVYTFAPTQEKEFPRLGARGVTFRKTLKIRLHVEPSLPPIQEVRAFTDSPVQPMAVKILWDAPALKKLAFDGEEEVRFEAYNGKILAVKPLEDSSTRVDENCAVLPQGMRGGVELQLAAAVDPSDDSPDRTVITVRSVRRPFSFAPQELLLGRKIFIDDLGILITKADDPTGINHWRETLREFGRKTVYDRVTQSGEQTLDQAWNDMPLKRPLYFVHGLPGNRNNYRQDPNGDLAVSNARSRFQWHPSPKDSQRKLWRGNWLLLGFGFADAPCGRELLEGYLPPLRTWWQNGPLYYEQTTIPGKLEGGTGFHALDDPTVLMMRVRVVNTSSTETAQASLSLSARTADGFDRLELDGDRVYARLKNSRRRLRYLLQSAAPGKIVPDGRTLHWSLDLKPGQSHDLYFAIPSITLTGENEIAALARRKFDVECRTIGDYWRKLAEQTTQISTPEPWLNGFYKAHAQHLEVNCLHDPDPKSSRRYAVVGSFGYNVFPNESAMMISDLDRRGMHQTAADCLQTMLDFQGTVPLPGNFQSREGVLFGAGGLQHIGYNKHHGYTLWCLAEHWKFTRDRAWMERAAPELVAGCEWIIRERKATMQRNADGSKPIAYGFLPDGALEDVQDYWYWLATNAATVWGFDAVAEALADYGHPQAKRLQAEAKAYHNDVMQGLTESRILAPVVRLRDGTHVPKYPSHPHLRGRAVGWIRETLEGALFLPAYGLIPADAPETTWILKDYEDNLYISDRYGYAIPTFEKFWFSRGGFSMQANLLDGPLPYLYRDDVKQYLRAFFNGFASGFYPETKMLNEHARPELGYPMGDHFKTSDEAQVTYWLRLMFVREAGQDLYLGQAIPRYWLRDGNEIGIRNAATYFGPMSLAYQSSTHRGKTITVQLDPPRRNPPKTIYLRLRHPEEKPIKNVVINGKPYDRFDVKKEWIVLPGDLKSHQTIVVAY